MRESLTSTAPAPATPATVEAATYTVRDLALVLHCSERHVWRQIDLGLVPGVLRIGRLVRLHRATVDSWLAAGAPAQRRAGR
jgi:excisionase family DNA binding protein